MKAQDKFFTGGAIATCYPLLSNEAVVLGVYNGNLEAVVKGGMEMAKASVMDIALPLAGIMILWLGLMRLAERAGLVRALARILKPVLRLLFPEIPADHPAMGAIVMCMAGNFLGLANAATALGIKAMTELQKLNPYGATASNSMCTFLTLNTACIQLIPATAVGILAVNGAKNPTAIVGTSFFAQIFALSSGLIAVKLLQNLPIFRAEKVAIAETAADAKNSSQPAQSSIETAPEPAPLTLGGKVILTFFSLFFVYALVAMVCPDLHIGSVRLSHAPLDPNISSQSLFSRGIKAVSILAIPFFLSFFPLYASLRKIKVYEEFIEGAKEGFNVALRIMPYLVAILSAVGMFRAAHGIDMMAQLLSPILNLLHFPADLLPLAFMRPLSGSGSFGIMAEIIKAHGADHIYSTMAGTIMGCTETTFYVVAVYFGAVGVRRTRHAIACGLIADAVGIVAAIIICRMMFG